MAAKLNLKLPLPDKTKLKIMGAKFNAWWNGTEFVDISPESEEIPPEEQSNDNGGTPENEGQAISSKPAASNKKIDINSDGAIFGASVLWGEGRLTPANSEFDLSLIKELGLNKSNKFGLLNGDAGALASNIIKSANCKTEVFFSEAKVKDAAQKFIKSNGHEKFYSAKIYDGTPKSVPKNRFDQVLMLYISGSKSETESNIFALARMLKPKGIAAWVNFVARDGEDGLEDSSGSKRWHYLSNSDILPAFEASGLMVANNEECSAELLNAYYKRQTTIVENWEAIQGKLMQNGGIDAVQAALEQTMVWRARIHALRTGRLHLRKIIVKHA